MPRPKVYVDPVQMPLVMERAEKTLFEQRAHALNCKSFNDFVLMALREKCIAINTSEELRVKLAKLEAEKKGAENEVATKAAELELTKASLQAIETFNTRNDPKFAQDYTKAVELIIRSFERGAELEIAQGQSEYLKNKFKRNVPPEKLLQDAYVLNAQKKTETMFR